MVSRNDMCWCGSGIKWKKCHYPEIPSSTVKDTAELRAYYRKNHRILIKTEEQIEGIREACRFTSDVLEATALLAKKGVTTLELNDFAHRMIVEAGGIPAALNYGNPPFPKSICTSFNNVICHGIPDGTALKEGDILNIDIACIYKGYFGDCSRMVTIGNLSPERMLVVDVAYECLMRSIAILRPGLPLNKIGKTIEEYAHANGCSVVYQFVAHGVGVRFHENPQISHCYNNNDLLLAPGMTFTIEPMINAGVAEAVIDPLDLWTARTRDGKSSAQWEHTLLITGTGHEILTTWKR